MSASGDPHPKATFMSTHSVRSDATFSPSIYRKSIADMFGVLDARQQRELVESLALLPRHIHQLASSGQIAVPVK
ncbi:MAG TPA: hypothetical protein PLN33_00655 [Hyphomonadaceae bacterium]|nr:hypothetical protein [Hyphomonadaceae bacterium]HPN04659.1 hypothetical protein [Hyphomonadaceae bacterium]